MKTTRTTKTDARVAGALPGALPGAPTVWSVPFSTLLGEVREPRDRDRDPTAAPSKEERRSEREEESRAARAETRVEPPTLPPPGPRSPSDVERPAAASSSSRPSDPPLQVIADQMLRGLCINQVGAQTSLRMELSTPRLARVGIEMRVEAGRLRTRFRVPDLAGREILRASASELAAGLDRRGIDVEAIQVDLESEAAQDGRSGDRDQDRGGRQRERPRPRRGRRGGFVL